VDSTKKNPREDMERKFQGRKEGDWEGGPGKDFPRGVVKKGRPCF